MRWVVLTDDWPPQIGGVATWSHGAAVALAAAGAEVRVFARARPGLVQPEGVRVTGVRGPSFGRRGPWWTAARAARALTKADAVLATTWTMAQAVSAGLLARGVPLHIVFHGSELTRPGDVDALKRVAGSATGRWAVSRFLVDQAGAHGLSSAWIPSPIEPVQSAWSADGPWAFVGRATALKGGDRFVRLVARAGVDGIVVGDGPELAAWKRLARVDGARVDFFGAVPRAQLAHRLDGCALTALLAQSDAEGRGAEGLGLTLVEACAAGRMPLGTEVGGIPEAVGPGLALCPEDSDAPARIREALTAWRPDEGRAHVATTHGGRRLAKALLERS